MRRVRRLRAIVAVGLAVASSSCVLAPRQTRDERARLAEAGRPYERPAEERQLPPLPQPPDWRDVLQHAFLANGELEAAYFEWKAALARIDVAAAYPNTNVSLDFEYMFSKENLKGWDRTTLRVGFDPMQNLSFPSKILAQGRVAFEEARAAGKRFEAAKFSIQERVLSAYLDHALLAEKVRIQEGQAAWLQLLAETAAARVRAGAPQQDLLNARVAAELAGNDLDNLQAEVRQQRARLNGMLGRTPDAELIAPAMLPEPRPVPADDQLLAAGTDNNPELAALAHAVAGRGDALELARLQYIPDISPFAGLTGTIEQFIGAAISIPLTIPMIRGAIKEAEAMLRSTEATARQTGRDRAASFVATMLAMRNNDRQVTLLVERIFPAAKLAATNARQAYATGGIALLQSVESERALLDVRGLIAEGRIAREKRLAELEALAGVDVETLTPAAIARKEVKLQ